MEKKIFIKRWPIQFDDMGVAITSYDNDQLKDEVSELQAEGYGKEVFIKDMNPLYTGMNGDFFIVAFEIDERHKGPLPFSSGN